MPFRSGATYFQNAVSWLSRSNLRGPARQDFLSRSASPRSQRITFGARSRPTDVGRQGEWPSPLFFAATEARETRNLKWKAHRKPFQEMISHWLPDMGLVESFRMHEIARAPIAGKPKSAQVLARVNPADRCRFRSVSGLPVVTLLQYVPEGSNRHLEQPEIHLHRWHRPAWLTSSPGGNISECSDNSGEPFGTIACCGCNGESLRQLSCKDDVKFYFLRRSAVEFRH